MFLWLSMSVATSALACFLPSAEALPTTCRLSGMYQEGNVRQASGAQEPPAKGAFSQASLPAGRGAEEGMDTLGNAAILWCFPLECGLLGGNYTPDGGGGGQ